MHGLRASEQGIRPRSDRASAENHLRGGALSLSWARTCNNTQARIAGREHLTSDEGVDATDGEGHPGSTP